MPFQKRHKFKFGNFGSQKISLNSNFGHPKLAKTWILTILKRVSLNLGDCNTFQKTKRKILSNKRNHCNEWKLSKKFTWLGVSKQLPARTQFPDLAMAVANSLVADFWFPNGRKHTLAIAKGTFW